MRRYLDTKYLVSIDGRIFNENTGRELKQQRNGNGYLKVTLTVNGKQVQKLSHRIVAETYLINKSIQVNHKDGNKSNNHVDNLEWVTASENQIHAHKTGLKPNGNALWNGKFSKEDIDDIKNLAKNGMLQYKIASKYNTTKGTISEILSGKRYKYI